MRSGKYLLVQLGSRRVLGVKGIILTVDLPDELRAQFDCLSKLLFDLARRDRFRVPQASDAAIHLREQSVKFCILCDESATRCTLAWRFCARVYYAADHVDAAVRATASLTECVPSKALIGLEGATLFM
jgi:hypothetical protein